jgi:2-amino-4-hydroxy-6-hydroxymethyldihydropteridine diphosphokinase
LAILAEIRSAPPSEVIILALGGNLAGDYHSLETLLEAAISALPDAGVQVVQRSGWWRSAAWPDPRSPAYLNAVAIVETRLGPTALLDAMQRLEAAFGRKRAVPNAPRTLDIDLIAYGNWVIDEPGLTLPHPRAHERRFVMGPLAEIAPSWRHPVLGRTAADLAARATIGADARPVGDPG